MRNDSSRNLYNKYFYLKNRVIEITLKNGSVIKGRISGFYNGDESLGDPYIIKWHIQTDDNAIAEISEIFDALDGEIVEHRSIRQIRFEQDDSIMTFE